MPAVPGASDVNTAVASTSAAETVEKNQGDNDPKSTAIKKSPNSMGTGQPPSPVPSFALLDIQGNVVVT